MYDKYELTLSITQKHIDLGIPNNCGACPIALAFWDYFGNGYSPVVAHKVGIYKKHERGYEYGLVDFSFSQEAKNFIENFDNHKTVSPCLLTFTLR